MARQGSRPVASTTSTTPTVAAEFVERLGAATCRTSRARSRSVPSAGPCLRWRDQIAAWHQAHVSNGPTEASDKLIKPRQERTPFGFTRWRNYRDPRTALRRTTQLGPTRHHHTPLKSDEPIERASIRPGALDIGPAR